MGAYLFNPITGKLDRAGDGGGGGGGDVTIITDDGTFNASAVGIAGQQAGTVPVVFVRAEDDAALIEDRTWTTQYVVDASTTPGLRGTYSTLQAALDQQFADYPGIEGRNHPILIRGTITGGATFNAGQSVHIFGMGTTSGEGQIGNTASLTGALSVPGQCQVYFSNLLVTSVATGSSLCFNGCNIGTMTRQLGDTSPPQYFQNSRIFSLTWDLANCIFVNCIVLNSGTTLTDCQFSFTGGQWLAGTSSIMGTSFGTFNRVESLNVGGDSVGSILITDCQLSGTIDFPSANLFYNNLSHITDSSFDFVDIANSGILNSLQGNVIFRKVGGNLTSVTKNDQLVQINAAGASVSTDSTDFIVGQQVIIQDISGGAFTSPISITDANGVTFNGQPNCFIHDNYGSIVLTFDGTNFSFSLMQKKVATPNNTLSIGSNGYQFNVDVRNDGFSSGVSGGGGMSTQSSLVAGNGATLTTFTLPDAGLCTVGSTIEVIGRDSGGWRVGQNAGQFIHAAGVGTTTTGVTGYIESNTDRYACIKIKCVSADGLEWVACSVNGVVSVV